MSQQPLPVPPVRTPEPGGGISARAQELKDIMSALYPQEEKTDFQKLTEGLGGFLRGAGEAVRYATGDMAGERLGDYLQQMRGQEGKDAMASEKAFIRTLILADLFGKGGKSEAAATEVTPTAGSAVKPTPQAPAKPVPKEQKISFVSPAYDLERDVLLGLDSNMVNAYGPLAGMGLFNARSGGLG